MVSTTIALGLYLQKKAFNLGYNVVTRRPPIPYLVDAFTAVKEKRLKWSRNNQDTLRAHLYHNVCDAVIRRNTNAKGLEKRIVLAGTFTGGPRYMMSNYRDAMALCRTYRNPDLFITFTSNPKWPKIFEMLSYLPGQKPHDRPEVVIYVIEFQKGGIPHVHILLWLEEHYKCITPSQIDDIISAEIPCQAEDPKGYKVVTEFMLHCPCGKDANYAPCNIEEKCSKHFPKAFNEESIIDADGYPIYHRRDNKSSATKGKFRPLKPWNENWEAMSEDILHKKRKLFKYPDLQLSNEQIQNYCIMEIKELLNRHGRDLSDFSDLPKPNLKLVTNMDNRLIREALAFDMNKSKTFLYKTIMARLRSERMIVLAVASSGIASLLLPGERTAHSRFIIPLELMKNSTCRIKQNTYLAELMQQVQLIIWDEAPMTHKYAFEALDKTLRDILGYKNPHKRNQLFGGLTVLLGGDFRQILPVIPKGKRADVVHSCINRSQL
ncbi:ATP-dependent DNA helicase PIF1-like protein [Tanacetum coccineum]